MTEKTSPIKTLEKYLNVISLKKFEDITAIDIGGLTSYTDIILIITGKSNRHVTSIAEHINISMKAQGILPLGFEGIKQGKWALLDFGDVIIHIFDEETKELYNLKGLWSDAPVIDITKFIGKN